MRIAKDYEGKLYDSFKDGKKLYEEIKVTQKNFFCPNCGKPVILRGKQSKSDNFEKMYHFSHMGKGCADSWGAPESSEWYKQAGRCFKGENVEKWLINDKGEKHLADVVVGNIVIMFKSKETSPEDFMERSNFFTKLGYDLAWVIGETRAWNSSIFQPIRSYKEYYGDMTINWSKPRKMLSKLPRIANTCSWLNGQRLSICISYMKNKEIYVNKVLWVRGSETDECILDWSKFRINTTCTYKMEEVVENPNILFLSPKEYIEDYVNSTGLKYKERLKGVDKQGASLNDYKCPRTNHSIKPDEECMNCSSCLGVDLFHGSEKKVAQRVFCIYPEKLGKGFYDKYGFAEVKRVAR